jgi:hypothetical protein
MRRDEKAIDALGRLATEGSPEVAGPAILALGRIGTPAAMRVVEPALARGPTEVRAAAAEACLIVADWQTQEGQVAAARALYEKVRRAELPLSLRVPATRGAIMTAENQGLALLIEQLHSPELAMRDVALLAVASCRARVTPGSSRTRQARLEMQALVIAALVDRGRRAHWAVSAGEVAERGVRVAALRGLAASDRPPACRFFAVITAPSGPRRGSGVVESRPNSGADEWLCAAALSAVDARRWLIGVLGDRKAGARRPFDETRGRTGSQVSKAAFRALGLLARRVICLSSSAWRFSAG